MTRLSEEELRARLRAALGKPAPSRSQLDLSSPSLARDSGSWRRSVSGGISGPARLLASVGVGAVVAAAIGAGFVLGHSGHGAPAGGRSSAPTATASFGPTNPFQPEAVTAISGSRFWVLGTDGTCTLCAPQIWETSNAGRTFASVGAPSTTFALPSQGKPSSVSDLRFADAQDGWAYGPSLWATHDDGAHWTEVDLHGNVVALEPEQGQYVYALVDTCGLVSSGGPCTLEVERSVPQSDAWTVVLTVTLGADYQASLGVQGSSVWLLDDSGLWRSLDAGASFTELHSPCDPALPGSIDPVSPSVVWAFCPTGMDGEPLRSTDGGATFTAIDAGETYNGGMVSGLSATTAFVTNPSSLRETSDGGAEFHTVSGFAGASPAWVGFTNASVGYVLTNDPAQLWRTTDGGSSWSRVGLP
jgi:photosystem II stability/assembly factor-like uncharacterized protein